MLIGCGCNCDEPIPSSVPHGSYHSSGTGASSLASGVSSGDPQGYCGPCYNLPNEWDITLSSAWWNYDYPARDYDCRSGLNGTFVLRPYGAASLSSKGALQSSFVIEDICTVWKSDQLAQFVCRLNRDGTANAGCRNSVDSIPRIELISGTSSFSGVGTCRSAVFMLFVWWLRPGMFRDEEQEGQWWSWTVPYDYSGGACHYRNCVRCWGADVGPPVGFFNAYSLNAGQIANWSTIPVCPHR